MLVIHSRAHGVLVDRQDQAMLKANEQRLVDVAEGIARSLPA
jgi:hypothetical protein